MDTLLPLRIGTRGSALARTQTHLACQALSAAEPLYAAAGAFAITPIKTSGDTIDDRPLHDIGGKALFCRELDAAVLADAVDIAIHSLKDIPAQLDPRLKIAAVLPRADCRDALVSMNNAALLDLPEGARIGTCSLRRQAQVLTLRPDVRLVPLRGNVPGRIEKMRRGDCDAVILAAAGLERLGLVAAASEIFAPSAFTPAGGQGFIAVVIAATQDNPALLTALARINHAPSFHAASIERAFLLALNGSCHTPIGAYCDEAGTLHTFLGSAEYPGLVYRSAAAKADADAAADLAARLLRDAPLELRRAAGLG
jgi:hydroxymethylbilane synthase